MGHGHVNATVNLPARELDDMRFGTAADEASNEMQNFHLLPKQFAYLGSGGAQYLDLGLKISSMTIIWGSFNAALELLKTASFDINKLLSFGRSLRR